MDAREPAGNLQADGQQHEADHDRDGADANREERRTDDERRQRDEEADHQEPQVADGPSSQLANGHTTLHGIKPD
jgi:hypothetical protein